MQQKTGSGCRFDRRKEGAKCFDAASSGSLTIEAALALSLFIFAMLAWMLLLQVIKVESMMQYALDQAALGLADHLSMTHTLSANEGALTTFSKKLGTRLPNIPGETILKEILGESISKIDAEQLFSSFLGKGQKEIKGVHRAPIAVDIDDEKDQLSLSVRYRIDLPGVLRPMGPLEVQRNTKVGLWLLTEDPLFGAGKEQEDDEKKPDHTIWQEPPFRRGRILVERRRKSAGGGARRFKMGQIADILHSGREIESILSLHLFSSTYATGTGVQVENYSIKQMALEEHLIRQVRKLKKAVNERRQLILEDGTLVDAEGAALRLSVIVPEEARHFSLLLEKLASQIQQQERVSIRFFYEEKALIEKKEAT